MYCTVKFPHYDLLCPKCAQWQPVNLSLEHEQTETIKGIEADGTVLLSNAEEADYHRLKTGPWDLCFGGGIVDTAVVLIGGEPGAGKSTLASQIADRVIATTKREILYVASEEGVSDIKPRMRRIGVTNMQGIRVVPLGVTVDLIEVIRVRKPAAVIVDSLQGWTMDLNEQVEICKALKPISVEFHCPIIVISQVTKEEGIAGMMALQHAVDSTHQFLLHDGIRELSTIKNRFGRADTSVSVFFDMTGEKGLVECEDPFTVDEEEDNE